MTQLALFSLVIIGFSVRDIRAMYRRGLMREIAVYAALSAAALALAALYLPTLTRRSIMDVILKTLRIGG